MKTTETWIVLTDSHGWGRGEYFSDAVDRALEHSSKTYPPKEAVTYQLTSATEFEDTDCYVDELGTLHWPTGVTMKKVKWPVPEKLIKARTLFAEECEEVRYSPLHDKAFDS